MTHKADYDKQYYRQHADELKKYGKKYYQQHIDDIKLKNKQKYEENKDILNKLNLQYYNDHKEQLNQKIVCKCNGRYTFKNKSRHFKSRIHQTYIQNQNNETTDESDED